MRWLCLTFLVLLSGCNADKIAQLEKQNQELAAKFDQQKQMVDLDTQTKCSNAAKQFFRENWMSDKNTILLTYNNHFNKSIGKCFIVVEWHYKDEAAKTGSWYNSIMFYDVLENLQYGELSVYTDIQLAPTARSQTKTFACSVNGKKCKDASEFSQLTNPFMND